jgi:hypothetical protein
VRRQITARAGVLLVAGVCLLWLTSAASASAATSATVYLDQPGLSEAAQPSSFRLAEYESADMHTLANSAVSAVSWSSWGSATAEGSGQALIQWTDATTGLHTQERATVPVVVSASGLRSCGGVSVYTSLVINPAAGASAPPHFAQVQHDDKITVCTVHGGSYVAGKERAHRSRWLLLPRTQGTGHPATVQLELLRHALEGLGLQHHHGRGSRPHRLQAIRLAGQAEPGALVQAVDSLLHPRDSRNMGCWRSADGHGQCLIRGGCQAQRIDRERW